MPIVLGRVYDSDIEDDVDFGPGWKLTVREEAKLVGSRLTLVDSTNSRHILLVNGTDIVPETASLSDIDGGSLIYLSGDSGQRLTLRAGDLVRRFEQFDGEFRLASVEYRNATTTFAYINGRLNAIRSGDMEVTIERRDDGRIIGVSDSLDRYVAYEYDESGRLTSITDRAGSEWNLRYVSDRGGQLSDVVNPRGVEVLSASFAGGRADKVRVLERETRFEYGTSSTRAYEDYGKLTIFEWEENGLTSGVVSPTGELTRISFDDNLRPIEVTRDGGLVADLVYDELDQLRRVSNTNEETRYRYGKHGLIRAYGSHPAQYFYDDEGRLSSAEDNIGKRVFEYSESGLVSSVQFEGTRTEFKYSERGALAKVVQDGKETHKIKHDRAGQIAELKLGESAAVTYSYDERGFRTDAEYGDDIQTSMSYDEVGNLTTYKLVPDAGDVRFQKYQIDPFNKVLSISNSAETTPQRISFDYDRIGRLSAMYADNRTAHVEYDLLDRAERVFLDGQLIVDRVYATTEQDIAANSDTTTSTTLISEPYSPVFGSVESIVYTRPHPTEYGVLSYSSSLKTFLLHPEVMAPDRLFRAGLSRTSIALDGSQALNPSPFGFDRPSNGMFVPAEYNTVSYFQ